MVIYQVIRHVMRCRNSFSSLCLPASALPPPASRLLRFSDCSTITSRGLLHIFVNMVSVEMVGALPLEPCRFPCIQLAKSQSERLQSPSYFLMTCTQVKHDNDGCAASDMEAPGS